jgi:RHS repeat-associated protein
VFARRYGYDAADQLVRLEDQARGVRAYEYDACERLLGVGGDAPERFVVDPAGNILARDAAGPAGAKGDAAPGDRLLRYRDGGEERTFAYDAWGNRVAERRAGGGAGAAEVAYRYGPDDQLREVRRRAAGEERVTRFGYDALGRRVWKATARLAAGLAAAAALGAGDAGAAEVPAETEWRRTAFLWTGDVLLAESDRAAEDALAAVYVYEPGTFRPLALARRAGTGAGAAVYRYHLDHLGTPQELTDGAGRVAWAAAYRAWGAARAAEGARVAQPLRFQGQYADAETGLHYNRHRYYSPAEGRFVHQDPIRLAGGDNVAQYAPNPTHWVDPLGLQGTPLLPGEGDVGTYRELRRAGSPGDGLTPHHMPSDSYMRGRGVPGYSRNEGISMNMEQPEQAPGGRHRATASYGSSPDLSVSPRDALARDVWDARSIYIRDGQYTPEIRRSLRQVIAENKQKWPGTFDKPGCGF